MTSKKKKKKSISNKGVRNLTTRAEPVHEYMVHGSVDAHVSMTSRSMCNLSALLAKGQMIHGTSEKPVSLDDIRRNKKKKKTCSAGNICTHDNIDGVRSSWISRQNLWPCREIHWQWHMTNEPSWKWECVDTSIKIDRLAKMCVYSAAIY